MNRNSIRWRLPASYGVIALLAALSLGSMMLLVLRDYYADQERQYLYGNATTLQPVIVQILLSDLPGISLQDQIRALAFLSQTQIRLLDTNGNTIADSGIPKSSQVVAVSGGAPVAGNVMFSVPANPPQATGPMVIYRNDANVPVPPVLPFEKEVVSRKSADIILSVNASPYGYGFVARSEFDPTRRSSQSVSVLLMASNGAKLGRLEISNGPSYGANVIHSVVTAWLVASVFAIVIAALAGWYASRQVTQPVLALTDATRRMENGKLSTRVVLRKREQEEFLALAQSFNNMAGRVEETVSTLRAFIADAAHELHTPLTALHTNLELAADEEDASRRTLFLTRAQQQSQRLEALVNGLLDLSRLESAHTGEAREQISLTTLLQELSETFASRAEQADRLFQLSLPAHPIVIEGKASQVRRAIENLLENSLKFTNTGNTIHLSLEQKGSEALITVSDNGLGIPSKDLPHIFNRFHRGHNASHLPGSGLGLAIVKTIVDEHQGQVEAQSKGPGEGSSFCIRLLAFDGQIRQAQ